MLVCPNIDEWMEKLCEATDLIGAVPEMEQHGGLFQIPCHCLDWTALVPGAADGNEGSFFPLVGLGVSHSDVKFMPEQSDAASSQWNGKEGCGRKFSHSKNASDAAAWNIRLSWCCSDLLVREDLSSQDRGSWV